MRLTDQEVAAIRAATREAFGDDAIVRLFGSRVRDELKGGDVDLLLEVDGDMTSLRAEAHFLDALFDRIDERKVDISYLVRGQEPSAFVRAVLPGSLVLT